MSVGKLILGLGSIAGGSLAAWRLTQEAVEFRKLGPPTWWVMWRHPVARSVAPPPDSKVAASMTSATRVFRWDKDRWATLTPHVYDTPIFPDAAKATYVTGERPSGRSLYAQVWWSRKVADGPWSATKVRYAANVKGKLPR